MSPLKKKNITEQEAASEFVLLTLNEARDTWPTAYHQLKEAFKDKFVVEDETTAVFDLALAAIAQDLQAVKNLFPKEQAERIEKWVFKFIDTEDWGDYAIREVKQYGEQFQKDVENIQAGGDPLSAIPARLLHRWLGENITNCEVKVGEEKSGVISPVLLMMTMSILTGFLGIWKRIKDNFNLIEGDLPLDDGVYNLRDYKPEPVEKKPDGTIQYYDDQGNLREKWMPPEELEKLLSKGGAKQVYKVLIKGPWDGIKETYWQLQDETVEKFVDEKGYVYAVCAFEKGQSKYTLMKKKIWEQMDEVERIMGDPSLTQDQQVEAIKKLTDE